MFGLITFDHQARIRVPLQYILDENQKSNVRMRLNESRWGNWGGTSMYTAVSKALDFIESMKEGMETWIVCLTDGASADHSSIIESRLRYSSENLHIILIGVNLCQQLHGAMQLLCSKYKTTSNKEIKGFFIPTVAHLDAMTAAFQRVANCIPVSKTFELDGNLSDQDCRRLMKKYIPQFVSEDDMLLQSFWVKYLYRRVKVFDDNHEFNYNIKHESLGSNLMETMLSEVEQFLREDQIKSWSGKNHHQLIYDFTNKAAPEFRLICTSPDEMDVETRNKYESFDLPGFFIPTIHDLEQRCTLDRFLSQALNVPLSSGTDGLQRIKCIDDHSFVLTLDFTMKLLSIHERIACGIPCIIEGETGVSKTALTKMYSILVNSQLLSDAKKSTANDLKNFEDHLGKMGYSFESRDANATSYVRLKKILDDLPEHPNAEGTTNAAFHLFHLLDDACKARPCTFQEPPSKFHAGSRTSPKLLSDYLKWFSESKVERTFFEINVHSSLTEADILHYFKYIRETAKKLKESLASVVVFLDGK
jgi:hypothetical protein